MVQIPQNVIDLINDPASTKILVTASKDGRPHAIVCGSIGCPAPDTMVVGQVLMKRAAAYLDANKKAAFLICKGPVSYEINVQYMKTETSGPAFDGMKEALAKHNLPLFAVKFFKVCCVCDEGAGPNAGKKIA